MKDFVHLHNHTHYSLLDALSTTEGLIEYAKKNGQKAIALTDHGVMYGCLSFYKKAKEKGIKPIIGIEAYMANGDRHDKENKKNLKKKNYYHIVLLAKNLTGYKNLMKLSSIAFTEGFYYKPRIDRQLLEQYHEGLICLSACLGGVVSAHLIDSDIEEAYNSAKFYHNLFGDDFYLEIQNHNLEQDPIVLDLVPKMAKDLGIKLVATNDIHYLEKSHAVAHNLLLMIQGSSAANKGENNIYDLRYKQPEFYFKSTDEMIEIFKEYPDAISNTVEIADKCNLELDLKTNYMPNFPIPSSSKASNLNEYLEELVYEGLNERYNNELTDEIRKRADYEISVVNKMGFPGYFLIVWDFIKAARERGVSVGPGRGSAAGSLIAYALKITNVDPLKYDLLFERFLNPERVSMPDIDVDFADDKREIVLEYVKDKYGENAVSMISTFSKLAPKAALTDVGRVLGVDLAFIKNITKRIPVKFGKVTPLKEALELPELIAFKNDTSEKTQNLINFSLLLEDKLRGLGTHAAGVVIAPSDVSDYVPVCYTNSSKDQTIKLNTQYTMKDLEDAGLLKMDFLGLRTLSIIENTLNMVRINHNIDIDIDAIDFDDKKTYSMISDGDTLSIFQFESGGMQEYLRKLKPENLEELTAMNALYRPGPMENIPEFINRKFGRSAINYPHQLMEKSLKTTYGIIVYQEQVMQLVQDLANFSLGAADLMRRAMGKKDMKIMEEQKHVFIEGASQNGIDGKLAAEIFDLIVKFANYGFNKSHSLAYSYLAFQTAWLKAHYTAEFLAANMTAEMNNQAKIVELKDEAKKFKIKVMPPDVNVSISDFFAINNTIYYGLAGIKNVGANAVESIIQARKEKPFENFFDFVSRVDNRLINKRSMEMLICAGAFDSLKSGHRAQLLASIDDALNWAKSQSNASSSSMDSLFLGGESEEISYPKLANVDPWTEQERLKYEKEVMNFYVSGHPLLQYEAFINSFTNFDLSQIAEMKKLPETVKIVGMISDIKTKMNAKGNSFAITSFEDIRGKAECIFWADAWKKFAPYIENDGVYIITGKLNNESDDVKIAKIIVTDVTTIDEITQQSIKGFKLWLDLEDEESSNKVNNLYSLSNIPSGKKSTVVFNLFDKSKDYRSVLYAEDLRFDISTQTILQISDIFGSHNIKFLLN